MFRLNVDGAENDMFKHKLVQLSFVYNPNIMYVVVAVCEIKLRVDFWYVIGRSV